VLLRSNGGTDVPPGVDWDAIVALEGTIVCYASNRLACAVLQTLLAHGVTPERTAAMIYHGAQPQATTTGTLTELLAHTAAAAQDADGVLVISEVVSLRDHLRWFDERPLFGKRIVVAIARAGARTGGCPRELRRRGRSKPRPSG
jgi:uroporphyrinogen III methyltransferase/synthase